MVRLSPNLVLLARVLIASALLVAALPAQAGDRPAPLLAEIESRIAELKAVGRRAALLFDLPGGLFETCPRELALLEAFVDSSLPKDHRIRRQVRALATTPCDGRDAPGLLRSVGVRDRKLLRSLRDYHQRWRNAPRFLAHLRPRPGAQAQLAKWRRFGAILVGRLADAKSAPDAWKALLARHKLALDRLVTIGARRRGHAAGPDTQLSNLTTSVGNATWLAAFGSRHGFLARFGKLLPQVRLVRLAAPGPLSNRSPSRALRAGFDDCLATKVVSDCSDPVETEQGPHRAPGRRVTNCDATVLDNVATNRYHRRRDPPDSETTT